ncbi:hypothetical protein MJL48_34075, partial [Salmonella enterica subsp. enterica serovar Kentucky]|nr:hypothetical protein [Salmonella enterica subsp. enterica serovar Kentucky]
SKGLYSARKAIMQHYQARGMRDVTVEDIYIGNGVSELIVQAMMNVVVVGLISVAPSGNPEQVVGWRRERLIRPTFSFFVGRISK